MPYEIVAEIAEAKKPNRRLSERIVGNRKKYCPPFLPTTSCAKGNPTKVNRQIIERDAPAIKSTFSPFPRSAMQILLWNPPLCLEKIDTSRNPAPSEEGTGFRF
jgi:hypothetical protein